LTTLALSKRSFIFVCIILNHYFSRFTALQDSLQIRKENLDDSQALHQLLRDIDEQIVWLNEKIPLASSEELGKSLDEVKALQRKHQVGYGNFYAKIC
jgi:hypothetical protein